MSRHARRTVRPALARGVLHGQCSRRARRRSSRFRSTTGTGSGEPAPSPARSSEVLRGDPATAGSDRRPARTAAGRPATVVRAAVARDEACRRSTSSSLYPHQALVSEVSPSLSATQQLPGGSSPDFASFLAAERARIVASLKKGTTWSWSSARRCFLTTWRAAGPHVPPGREVIPTRG